MEIRIKHTITGPHDVHMFNHLNVWCAERGIFIESFFNGEQWETTMRGDKIVMIDMFAYLVEKQNADI